MIMSEAELDEKTQQDLKNYEQLHEGAFLEKMWRTGIFDAAVE